MDPDLGKDSKRLEESRVSRKSQTSELPSLHHRKEGWPSDQENAAKPPLIARPGVVFRMKWWRRKTTPAASFSVASHHLISDAATPPCGDARRGIGSPKSGVEFENSLILNSSISGGLNLWGLQGRR